MGLPIERARRVTEDAGLTLDEPIAVQTIALPEGTVVAQEPGAGTTMAAGDAIVLTVSTRQDLVTVPDVTGKTEAEAVVDITRAGLHVGGVDTATDTTVPDGQVIGTVPAAGRQVAIGTTVRLIVAGAAKATTGPTASP